MTPELDPVIHQPTRLRLMAVLHRNRQCSFTDLRDGLGLTPGNLASHMARPEEAGYVKGGRVLVDFSFEVQYKLTDVGAAAFRVYLAALQALVRDLSEAPAAAPLPPAEPAAPEERR